ncbi:MAG: HlyD family type I secretion periplasmic adaptor subunit [Alphaproteobacteria bacterium]
MSISPKKKTVQRSWSERLTIWQKLFDKALTQKFFNSHWEDGAFMDDVRQATLRGVHPMANLLFYTMGAFILLFLVWAAFAQLDETTRGDGAVIPSGKVQTVQNLDGGYVKEILVRQGDVVEKDDVLLVIDNSGVASSFEERKARYYNLLANVARLEAEVSGAKPVFPPELETNAPRMLEEANNLYLSRVGEVQSAMEVLERQVEQRRNELTDAKSQAEKTLKNWKLSRQEFDMAKPMKDRGVISEVELLRLERETTALEGDKETARLSVPKADSALREAQSRLKEAGLKAQNEARQKLGEARDELARIKEVLKGDSDKVDRTTVRAPVRAEVKQVLINTVGGVIQPAQDLVELIPLDDSLLVEARIKPQDIGFIRPRQEAVVKITAYDFAIYGGLDGLVEGISPDTVTDEEGNAYYVIKVRTNKNFLGDDASKLPIISGMVATVDILTGKKSVLDYLLKPLRKAREKALHER